MKRSAVKQILVFPAALAAFVLISCILGGDKVAGRGSEVENELGVYGRLVGVDGDPIRGARMAALPEAASADTDTVFTGSDGKYVFDSLPMGRYNLVGEFQNGSLVVLIPGIDISVDDSLRDLGTDTLRAPGGVRGRMMVGNRGKSGVLCFIPGFPLLDVSDDSGRFEIGGLPQGRYSMRYSAPGFIIAPDSGVEVWAGRTTILPDKRLEYDPESPPPSPTGLRASYDTLAQRVTLSWDAVPVSDLAGFVVYRDDILSPEPIPLRGGFTSKTVFEDTGFSDLAVGEIRAATYRLKARDVEANVSVSFSPSVRINAVSRSLVTTILSVSVQGDQGGEATLGDTLRFSLAYANPTRRIVRIAWRMAGDTAILRERNEMTSGGTDTIMVVASAVGHMGLLASLLDEAGSEWTSGAEVDIHADPPVAFAGKDTVLTPGDGLALAGKGTDRLGAIVSWAWDIGGTGAFQYSDSGRLSILMPAAPGNLIGILRVTDDDGNSAMDTIHIRIIKDTPKADAGADTLVSPDDSVMLRGMGMDSAGKIVEMAWDVDEKGFISSPDGVRAFKTESARVGRILCVFRVVDDDGNAVYDTLFVAVDAVPPIVMAGADTAVSIGDRVNLQGMAHSRFGTIAKWEWDVGATGVFRSGGPDTSFLTPKEAIEGFGCILRATDEDGIIGLDTLYLSVRQDIPVADAGGDTTVSVKDEIHLRATARQEFGSIVSWEWKCGSETGFQDRDSAFTRQAPQTARESYPCVVRVMDEDGNMDLDTVVIRVVLDPPVAKITYPDVPLQSGEAARFDGSGSVDAFGSVVRWEWTLGGSAPVTAFQPITLIRIPHSSIDTRMRCILTVYDDDGNRDDDTVTIEVEGDPSLQWVEVSASLGTGPFYMDAVLEFNQRMWVFGRPAAAGGGWEGEHEVWSSQDGLSWTRHTTDAGFRAINNLSVWTYGGKMWALAGSTPGTDNGYSIWNSLDGATWANVSEHAPFGSFMTIVEAFGKMFAFGGEGNDIGVRSSIDGVAWTTEASNLMPIGNYHPKGFKFNGDLWMFSAVEDQGETYISRSADGEDWVRAGGIGTYLEAQTPSFAESGGRMFRFAPLGPNGYTKDVWATRNGTAWSIVGELPRPFWAADIVSGQTQVVSNAVYALSFNGKAWVFGYEIGPGASNGKLGLWRTE